MLHAGGATSAHSAKPRDHTGSAAPSSAQTRAASHSAFTTASANAASSSTDKSSAVPQPQRWCAGTQQNRSVGAISKTASACQTYAAKCGALASHAAVAR